MTRIAIVGGGPGGLFSASFLAASCADLCRVTLFEASPRLGGKVSTRRFSRAPVLYEAGVAELYDYSHFGPDPLKELVETLGLSTVPMTGTTVVLGDAILRDDCDVGSHFGAATLKALDDFHRACVDLCPPAVYYEGHSQEDNRHPWAHKTFREVLDEIPDETARRYLEVAVRSDLATEPHLTSALNGLKNVLMDDPRYLQLYSIVGGIERLTGELAARLEAEVVLEAEVTGVEGASDGTYQLNVRRHGRSEVRDFDMVILALPNYWLERLEWGSRGLRLAIQKHLAHYDHPAHYLRVTVLFERPFWRDEVPGSYFMSDAFGGCCVYDEGARHPCDPHGVLGWLIAGNDALALSNLDDDRLIALALDSLPGPLAHGQSLFVEGQVHRWVGSINGLPGGRPMHDLKERHLPDAGQHPGLFLVGDYLFDSTLNGAYDSAAYVTERILTLLRKRKYAPQPEGVPHDGHAPANGDAPGAGVLDTDYHDLYDCHRTYEESFEEYFCEKHATELIRAVWGGAPPYRLLDCGSASGQTLAAFERVGVEAWGVENNKYIHARTPREWRSRNFLGDVRRLPFADDSFDFVYDTCLCYLDEGDLDRAIGELYRVCRVGVYFAGVASDMTREVIEAHELFDGVRSLHTFWEWSELFVRNGFRMAVNDLSVLSRIWEIESAANEGDFPWYPDADRLRHCFFTKPDARVILPPGRARRGRETLPIG